MISYGGLFSQAVLRVQAAPFVNRLGACAGGGFNGNRVSAVD
jgi:hypothetical protein